MSLKYIKEKLGERKCKKGLRCFCAPKKEFLEKTSSLFLAELKNKGIVTTEPSFGILSARLLKWQTISLAILIIFLISGSSIIYAYSQNVSVDHPLYGLKRFGENIRLATTSGCNRIAFSNQMAHRRLVELEDINSRNLPVIILTQVNNDFDSQIVVSVQELKNQTPQQNPQITKLCLDMQKIIAEHQIIEEKYFPDSDNDAQISQALQQICDNGVNLQ